VPWPAVLTLPCCPHCGARACVPPTPWQDSEAALGPLQLSDDSMLGDDDKASLASQVHSGGGGGGRVWGVCTEGNAGRAKGSRGSPMPPTPAYHLQLEAVETNRGTQLAAEADKAQAALRQVRCGCTHAEIRPGDWVPHTPLSHPTPPSR
jgi:hypothetical protein